MIRITRTAISATVVVVLALSAAPVFAEDGASGTSGSDDSSPATNQTEVHKTELQKKLEEARQKAKTEKNSQACTSKRKAVVSSLNRIAERGQKQISVFTKIADRTEQFKTDKNLTVDHYDSLVTAVSDKKTAAETTLNKIKTDAAAAAGLSCDPGQPRAIVSSFRDDLKAENSALKAYKTAIKNLIVAVKSSKSASEGGQ